MTAASTPATGGVAVEPIAVEPIAITRLPLEVELATAGARLRTEHLDRMRPEPDFVQKLRAQLLEQLPSSETPAPASIVALPRNADGHGLARRRLPRVAWHRPNVRRAPSWAAAIAAGLIIGLAGLGAGRALLASPVPPASQALDVAGATMLRAGQVVPLVSGANIQAGDEVRTAPGGHAFVALGASRVRLSGSADLIVTAVADNRIVLQQVAGRIYHRVSQPDGGTYAVATAGVTWTSRGTAFDLDREPEPGGGTRLTLLTVEHAVLVDGPGVSVTVPQGREADLVVGTGSEATDFSTGVPDASVLADPWLAENAARDVADGFAPGILAAIPASQGPSEPPAATASPTPVPTPTPSPSPTTEPSASPTATPVPTATPTVEPTTQPTPKATPEPTATPTPGPTQTLGLTVRACPGGTILDWSAASSATFDHYKTYRSSSASFAAPVLVGGTTTTSRSATSAADVNASGKHWYRTFAYDAADQLVARSVIQAATGAGGPDTLDPFVVGPAVAGAISFSWSTPSLPAGCFSATKLIYAADSAPNIGHSGTELLWTVSDASTHSVSLGSAPAGTWWFRVQAVVDTALGRVVVAQSTPVQVTVAP